VEASDLPEAFEEHFLAGYLQGVEGCEVVRHRVPHAEGKHASLAALGYSPRGPKYVGCDVLDWFDRWWPPEMNPSKVLPKLEERVALFRRRVSVEEAMEAKKGTPRMRFVFFGFGPLSPRLIAAIPRLGSSPDVETEWIHGERLLQVARKVAVFSLSRDAPPENHFVRSARLLAESGWSPEVAPTTEGVRRVAHLRPDV
jgi:hypothetical protein